MYKIESQQNSLLLASIFLEIEARSWLEPRKRTRLAWTFCSAYDRKIENNVILYLVIET